MQFLLLLSALLSAVTGVFVGPRTDARVPQAEAQVVSPAQTVAPVAARTEPVRHACGVQKDAAAPPTPRKAAAYVAPPLAKVCLIE